MIRFSKSAGFSLVELMIVVAIIAILAAVAIPSYMRFQLRARETEARNNLAAIRTCEEAYKAENDVYLAGVASPAGGGLGTTPIAWADGGGWTAMGFSPDGEVRYLYTAALVAGGAGVPPSYTATATGDVDGDGTQVVITVTGTSSNPTKLPVDEY